MELKTVFTEYLEFCELYRKLGTFKAYKKSFVLLSKVFDALDIKDSSELTQIRYNEMIKWLKSNTNKKNSKINSLMSDLTTALRYNNEPLNFKAHKLTDDTTHYKALNDNELKQLLEYLESLDLRLSNNLVWVTCVYLMLDTGARKNEALNILNKEIDFTQELIYLETTKTTKRAVRFGALSRDHIKMIYDLKHDVLLWNRIRNEPLSKRSIELFFERINKNIKLTSGNIHPHRLRKTFATQLLKKGCPLTTIQRLLGHSDIKMTMIYLDIDIFMINNDYDNYYPYNK